MHGYCEQVIDQSKPFATIYEIQVLQQKQFPFTHGTKVQLCDHGDLEYPLKLGNTLAVEQYFFKKEIRYSNILICHRTIVAFESSKFI